MRGLNKFLTVLGIVATLSGSAQSKQDSTEQLVDILHTKDTIDSGITIVAEGMLPLEECDDKDGYPKGTVIITKIDKEDIMNKLGAKYTELYKTDTIPLTFDAMNSLDDLMQSGELLEGSRVGFSTYNGFIVRFYIYKESEGFELPRCIKRKK